MSDTIDPVLMAVAIGAVERDPPRPADYPLPIHQPSGFAYWEINARMCLAVDGWSAWQKDRNMSAIIPEIDRRFEAVRCNATQGDRYNV